MTFTRFAFAGFFSVLVFNFSAAAMPGLPTDPNHPGGKSYSFSVQKVDFTCGDRKVNVFLPSPMPAQPVPLIVFGHGQALNESHYRASFEHLAKKGFVAFYPQYDNGFFDQDWARMAADYIAQTECVLSKYPMAINPEKIIISGHSKGAYVASIAAGQAFQKNTRAKPASVVLFALAGADASTAAGISANVELTAVFAEADTIVSIDFSKTVIGKSQSGKKQLILMKNYPDKKADHMFPLTKSTAFGGGPESALHYYGTWKWLTAAAMDLASGGEGLNPYLYGDLASDKGLDPSTGLVDSIERNF